MLEQGSWTQARVLRLDLDALPNWRARGRLIREHLVPPASYMRARYGVQSNVLLPGLYFWRALAVPRSGFAAGAPTSEGAASASSPLYLTMTTVTSSLCVASAQNVLHVGEQRVEHLLRRSPRCARAQASSRSSVNSSPAGFIASVTPSLKTMIRSPGFSVRVSSSNDACSKRPSTTPPVSSRRMPDAETSSGALCPALQ